MTTPSERLIDEAHPFHALFNRLVPDIGVAPTVNGEVCRLVGRIGYRWFNDGDRVGRNADALVGVASALRRLVGRGDKGREVYDALQELYWRRYSPDFIYEEAIERLTNAAVRFCENPDRPNPNYKEGDKNEF